MCRVIPRLIRIFATVFFALSVMLASAQDSQEFRDLKAQVEELQIDQMNREWDELEVQRKAEEAKRQAEMDAISVHPQQIPPLPQPDTGTDSLVKELRDIKDEIEESRIDADFRQDQAALQARLDAMTPEQRAAYWESQRLAREKAKADAIQAEAGKKAQEEEAIRKDLCHNQIPRAESRRSQEGIGRIYQSYWCKVLQGMEPCAAGWHRLGRGCFLQIKTEASGAPDVGE
jgi:hypothetical protein